MYEVKINEKPADGRESIRRRLAVDSWNPASSASGVLRIRSQGRSSSALRDVARSAASWTILLAISMDVLAVRDVFVLLSHRVPVRAACAMILAASGLSLIFGAILAVPVAAVHSMVRVIGRVRRGWHLAWPLPLLALAWVAVSDVVPHKLGPNISVFASRLIVLALFGGVLVLATAVTRIRSTAQRIFAAGALGALTLGLDSMLPPTIHREPRDLLWLCCVVSIASLLYPVRRRITAAARESVARGFALFCAACFGALFLAGVVAPNWRVYARDYGTSTDRLGRFCRTLLDMDGDGYSAVLWGTDCDDFDFFRNPGMAEQLDGRDRNCNGFTRPAASTPSQRGVGPAQGNPDAPSGEVERVVLITIDCLRNDVVSAAVSPNVTGLTRKGLQFMKLYGGGTRTATSLPLLLRGAYRASPVAGLLATAHVSSTAIFGYRHSTLGDNIFQGFQVVKRPDKNDKRFRASEVTDFALDDLRAASNARDHFLWVHYFDAHGPRVLRVLPPETPKFPPLANEDPESSLYLSQIAYVDREVGRLLLGIEQTGGFDKTVVILSSDHGEGFGLHGMYEHGESAFEEVTHVPGVLVAPGVPAGRYDHVTSHRDIAATILGAFGLLSANPSGEDFGRSWLRLRAAPESVLHDFVITYSSAEHVQQWSESPMMVRTDDHAKFAIAYRGGLSRFYHLDSPQREWLDVLPNCPAEVARDRRQLELYRDIDSSPP